MADVTGAKFRRCTKFRRGNDDRSSEIESQALCQLIDEVVRRANALPIVLEELEIRRGTEGTNAHTALRSYHQRALDVQREVLNLLIDERIAADTSLMTFLSSL